MDLKLCKKCGKEKFLSEDFSLNSNKRDGRQDSCDVVSGITLEAL